MTRRVLMTFVLLALALGGAATAEAREIVLRPQGSVAPETICVRYGFTLLRRVDSQRLYLVDGPDSLTQADLDAIMAVDRDVANLELQVIVQQPVTQPELTQSVAAILEAYQKTFVDYAGASVWDYYVTQTAASKIRLADAHRTATGAGTIAIIDTGVDETHPALGGSLVAGYDFTRDLPGGSEWPDLGDALLQQSVAAILEYYWTVTLSQSVAAILEGGGAPPAPLPPYFGHGTMVAGLVHLTAPTSKIMPLKAFHADGSAELFDILNAIYYATDHGAKVINMSFILWESSRELNQALAYAHRNGVLTVAAVGNNGVSTDTYPVYPADNRLTFGVGSTTNSDKRAEFSNYGGDVSFGAPGEMLITLYPGGLYSICWGTSFSTGLGSGTLGVMLQKSPALTIRGAQDAFDTGSTKLRREDKLGAGRIDVFDILQATR